MCRSGIYFDWCTCWDACFGWATPFGPKSSLFTSSWMVIINVMLLFLVHLYSLLFKAVLCRNDLHPFILHSIILQIVTLHLPAFSVLHLIFDTSLFLIYIYHQCYGNSQTSWTPSCSCVRNMLTGNISLQATYYCWRDFTCWFNKASEILSIFFTPL